jgi:hypothetical protein
MTSTPNAPPPPPEGVPQSSPPRSPWLAWALLGLGAVVLLPVALWAVFLLPGATTLLAWDCLSDLECSFALGTRGNLHPKPADYSGVWAGGMGTLMGALGVLVASMASRTVLRRKGGGAPVGAIAALTVALLAFDVLIVGWLETLI